MTVTKIKKKTSSKKTKELENKIVEDTKRENFFEQKKKEWQKIADEEDIKKQELDKTVVSNEEEKVVNTKIHEDEKDKQKDSKTSVNEAEEKKTDTVETDIDKYYVKEILAKKDEEPKIQKKDCCRYCDKWVLMLRQDDETLIKFNDRKNKVPIGTSYHNWNTEFDREIAKCAYCLEQKKRIYPIVERIKQQEKARSLSDKMNNIREI